MMQFSTEVIVGSSTLSAATDGIAAVDFVVGRLVISEDVDAASGERIDVAVTTAVML